MSVGTLGRFLVLGGWCGGDGFLVGPMYRYLIRPEDAAFKSGTECGQGRLRPRFGPLMVLISRGAKVGT